MSRFARLCALGVVLTSVNLAAAPASPPVQAAAAAKPLPAFALADLSGAPVASATLAVPDRWLLVYVATACDPCKATLDGLAAIPSGTDVSRMAIVVRGNAAQVRELRDRYPTLAQARWYVEAGREGSQALRLAGIPAMVGWRTTEEAWRAQGATSRERARSLAESWLIK